MSRTPFVVALSVLLYGCANPPPPMALGPDHPASVDAEQAPLPAASRTLVVENTAAPATEAGGPAHDHAHHPMDHMGGMQMNPTTRGEQ